MSGQTFRLRLRREGEVRPWRWYRTREQRDEAARQFRKHWDVQKRNPGATFDSPWLLSLEGKDEA